jgi:hypothetical protein
MQQQMRDVLDGYSIHVYWTPGAYPNSSTDCSTSPR